TLGNAAGQNVVKIIDETAPSTAAVSFSNVSTDIAVTYAENLFNVTGSSGSVQLNGAGSTIVTGSDISGNVRTLHTATTFANTDWLLLTSGSTLADAH